MATDYNKPIFKVVDRPFYSIIDESANKLSDFKRELTYKDRFKAAFREVFPKTLDTIDEDISLGFCFDALKCSGKMKVVLSENSKESFGVLMLCLFVTTGDQFHVYEGLRDWDEKKANLVAFIQKLKTYQTSEQRDSSRLVIADALDRYDKELKSRYLTLMYRWGSIVAKADNTITAEEAKWLSLLKQQEAQEQKSPQQTTTEAQKNDVEVKVVSSEVEENPYDELDALIGLSSVKEQVRTLANFVKIQKQRESLGMKASQVSYHCAFLGNPGTGKTTIARILAAIYKDLGILKKGQLVETDRAGLVGQYVGSTALKTNKVVDEALDGVLFIDEAYSLSEGGSNDFGKEAIATLIKRMEDDRSRLAVIFAGYNQNMEQFFDMNPGLHSRINRQILFPDYSENELVEIFKRIASKNEYTLSDCSIKKLEQVIHTAYVARGKNFGNARFVRNLFEKTIEHQANRLASVPAITPEILAAINEEDINSVSL